MNSRRKTSQSKPDTGTAEVLRDPEAAQSEEERSYLKKQRSRQVATSSLLIIGVSFTCCTVGTVSSACQMGL